MDEWQSRVDAVWADDALSDAERIARIDELAAERAVDDPIALFERAGAQDSAGREGDAEVLYRRALAGGLDGRRRAEARIQLASTLRNLGQVEESLRVLDEERRGGELADAAAAFYALALASAGDPKAAAAIALETLAPHLPQYTRSVAAYARELGGTR
ncbi:tetratricopeptide (TPR) repeat protein [Microbacterium resistens]|uniref:Tetratricopeptide (TPR) repeat protein n=1 Tax=Microbacterium resistens TaxID=156977 RepID=A0ABU1SFT6_9MICO|nr:tetratricopeptide repeat protein [Microbacterium resistens]MDR6868429.1 tetratricopeptide (TPR) repeat protein [Microbacterium resistens]